MNCKPGDLAICVRSQVPERLGIIVEVVGPAADGAIGWWTVRVDGKPCPSPMGWKARDSSLRPIRPQPDDAIDEMVLIAGKPEQVAA